MPQEYISRNPFNRKQRTYIKWYVKAALEQRFRQKQKPSTQEMASLADLFQLENNVVRVWFYNRRHKEKRTSLLVPTVTYQTTRPSDTGITINQQGRTNELAAEFAKMLMARSERISQHNGIDLYRFPLNRRMTQCTEIVNRFSFGLCDGKTEQKTVLVLGTKGLCHKKFINNMINYVVNVDPKDKFRFQLVEEDEFSQAISCISVYDIHYTQGFQIPYSLKIVVTPYLAESEDSEFFKNENIAEILRKFIEDKEGIQELDMICNVIGKGDTNQSFLAIFGKDVEDNLNSWGLTEDFLGDMHSWQAVIQHFFFVLARMKKKSLSLTKAVLEERSKVEMTVNRLRSLLTAGLAKSEEIRLANQTLMFYQAHMEMTMEQVDYMKQNLLVSVDTNFSSVCPKNCKWNLHHHKVYGLSYDVNRTDHDVTVKWQQSNALHNELLENGTFMLKTVRSIWRCIHRLNTITLCGDTFLSQKVFNLLFEAEQQLTQLGFQYHKI